MYHGHVRDYLHSRTITIVHFTRFTSSIQGQGNLLLGAGLAPFYHEVVLGESDRRDIDTEVSETEPDGARQARATGV